MRPGGVVESSCPKSADLLLCWDPPTRFGSEPSSSSDEEKSPVSIIDAIKLTTRGCPKLLPQQVEASSGKILQIKMNENSQQIIKDAAEEREPGNVDEGRSAMMARLDATHTPTIQTS
jgi:hypothetical protein